MFMQVLPSLLHPYKIAFDPFQYRKVLLRDQKRNPPRCSGLRYIRYSLPFSGIKWNLFIFYLARDNIKAGRMRFFCRNERPCVSVAVPPVARHRTVEEAVHLTTV